MAVRYSFVENKLAPDPNEYQAQVGHAACVWVEEIAAVIAHPGSIVTKAEILALWGARGKIGRVDYTYVASTATSAPAKFTGFARSASGCVARVLGSHRTGLLAVSYQYQKKCEVADEKTTFTYSYSATQNTFLTKRSYRGEPTLQLEHKLTLKGRYLNATGGGRASVAVLASAHALTVSKRAALNVSLFFLQTDDELAPKPMQGGVAFGYLTAVDWEWQSFSKGVLAEVFISTPFDLFKIQ